ncbi:MAG: hypothetical protein ACYST9_04495, partial [Planctomycetota bacterium]
VKWEGDIPEKATFKGGQNKTNLDMTFSQFVEGIDKDDVTYVKITIKSLKFTSVVRDNPTIDFDSSRLADQNSVLAKLIGKSYNITVGPRGGAFQVFNTQAAQNAVKGKGSDNIAALKLIDPNVVAERHSVIILPKPDESLLRVGDGWNMLKVYSFGLMGPKAYEKIYTINDIEQKGDQRLAVVEMEAIPSTELAEEIENMRQLQDFSDMFDTNEIYTGSLKFDLNSGKIQQYKENLSIEWLVVDPAAKQKDAAEPTAVRMRVVRDYNLERVK